MEGKKSETVNHYRKKKNMTVEFSHQGRRMLETLQSVILLKRDSKKKKKKKSRRQAEGERERAREREPTEPILRGHTMFGPLSLNPGRLSWLIMVDKPLYRTCSCHRH